MRSTHCTIPRTRPGIFVVMMMHEKEGTFETTKCIHSHNSTTPPTLHSFWEKKRSFGWMFSFERARALACFLVCSNSPPIQNISPNDELWGRTCFRTASFIRSIRAAIGWATFPFTQDVQICRKLNLNVTYNAGSRNQSFDFFDISVCSP